MCVMSGKYQLRILWICFMIIEQLYDILRNQRMHLSIQFINNKRGSSIQGIEDWSRKVEQFVCS